MKVFISWSGNTSLKVAQLLREWLPYVINSIEPYVSSDDIDKGARWSVDIAKELEDSTFGILCVTKDNLEAPWLSFEAGALSKTMEKSFVTPFLFDIKRSEVQGPILQFQSTIFEKEDIKKMVKTLNKACGDSGIPEARIDKSFEVWYPTLEKGLLDLKSASINESENPLSEESTHTSEILEEILDLSRDNQKLLKSPDSQVIEGIENMKELLENIDRRSAISYDQRRMNRKYSTMMLEEIMHMSDSRSSYGFLMTLSLFKDDFPWIYDMGKELVDILKGDDSSENKTMAIRDFRNMVDFTCSHPAMRDVFGHSKSGIILMKELPFVLMKYMDDMADKYINNYL